MCKKINSRDAAAVPFVQAAINELTHAQQILFRGGFNDRDKAVKLDEPIILLRRAFELFE